MSNRCSGTGGVTTNMLRQTPSTHKRPIYLTKTQPTILSRGANRTTVTSAVIKMEPSSERETVVVDCFPDIYTPHGPSAGMHNYSAVRTDLILDKTPQVV